MLKNHNGMKVKLILIGGIVAIILAMVIGIAIVNVKRVNIAKKNSELAKSIEYDQVKDGEEIVDDTNECVKFDAFFLRDLDGDGNEEKIRGTCKQIGQEDILYMNLSVDTAGYLKDAKITIKDGNFYFQTSLPQDEQLKDNYIGNNIRTIEFNDLNSETQKVITGLVRSGDYSNPESINSAIGDNVNNYSKLDSITLTGTYVNADDQETPITKTVNFNVDWYGTANAEIINQTQSTYSLENRIDENNKTVTLDFSIDTQETDKELILKDNHVTAEIPQLNGFDPISVTYTGSNADSYYDAETKVLEIYREAQVEEDGTVTSGISRDNSYTVQVVYPLEAYQNMGEIVLKIPVSTYYEGYNNTSSEFTNPYTSNTATGILTATYTKTVPSETTLETIVGKYLYNPEGRFIVSKEKPLKIYNGTNEDEKDDKYQVVWNVNLGAEGESTGLVLKETPDGQEQISDNFIKVDSSKESMENATSNIGIAFSGADNLLKEDGWIKVYDDETGDLLATFTKEDWSNYTSENPYTYEFPVKHIRVETSDTNANSTIYVYNLKVLDDEYITTTYTREDFDNFKNIESSFVAYMNGTDLGTSEGTALYEEPFSIAKVGISENIIPIQSTTKNEKITISASYDSANNEGGWVNGSFIVKLPEEILSAEINNVEIDNGNVGIASYELVERDGIKLIKINTQNADETPQSYNITIDVSLTPDSRISAKDSTIELYSANGVDSDYYYSANDIYDVNDNLNTEEKVNYNTINMSFVSSNSLLTNQIGSNYDDKGSQIVSPQVADVKPVYGVTSPEEEKEVTIGVQIRNNSENTISDIQILGKIPFEGNTYAISGENLNSEFTTRMKDTGITVPEDLQQYATLYYSENENPDRDLTNEQNGWKTAEEVTNWDNIKTYLIDLGEYVMPTETEYVFNYTVKIPEGIELNKVSYSHHGVYFSIDTDQGKYKTQTEPDKLGFRIAEKYNLELTKYQAGMDKVIPGVTYSITDDETGESKTAVTDTQGVLTINDLYAEKSYSLQEIKVPSDYELSSDIIKFTGHMDGEGNLSVEKTQGKTREDIQVVKQEGQDYKVIVKVEDGVKASLKIHKTEQGTEKALQNVKYRLTGYKLPENGRILTTNPSGEASINGLYVDYEYTLQETKAEGYYLSNPITFKIVNSNGSYAVQITNGTVKNQTVTEENNIPTVTLDLEDEKIPTYSLQIIKVKKTIESRLTEDKEEAQEELENDGETKEIPEVTYLSGAKFKLYKGTEEIGKFETDSTGTVTINNLYQHIEGKGESATYTLKEVLAPQGYVNIKDITFKVQNVDGVLQFINTSGKEENYTVDGNTVKLTIEDSPSFKLIKKDKETGELIPNVKFSIYSIDDGTDKPALNSKGEILGDREIINGREYYTVSTDEKGELVVDLTEGLYKAVEVEAPDKYDTKNKVYYFGIGTSVEVPEGMISTWAENVGGDSTDYISSVAATSDGGHLACGYFSSSTIQIGNETLTNKGNYDGIIIKYDAEGEVEWTKVIGGTGLDEMTSVAETSDGGFVAGGDFQSDTIQIENEKLTSNGLKEGVIIKYNSSGDLEWVKKVEGNYNDGVKSIAPTTDGGVLVGGYFASSSIKIGDRTLTNSDSEAASGYEDAFIVKFNAKGEIDWLDSFGNADSQDGVNSIVEVEDGSYIVAGFSKDESILMKYNSSGEVEWTKNIEQKDSVVSVTKASDGGFITGGYFTTNTINIGTKMVSNNGSIDGLVIKFNANGEVEWAKNIGGTAYDYIESIYATADEGFVVGGYFQSSTIQLENETVQNNGSYSYDGIIIKYNANGEAQWAENVGGNNNDYIESVSATSDGRGYIAGGYFNSTTIQVGNRTLTNNGSYGIDGLVIKFENKELPNPIVLKSKVVGGSKAEQITSLAKTIDGGYLAGGYFKGNIDVGNVSLINNGNNDGLVIKYNSKGEVEWANNIGGSSNDEIVSVTATSDGGCIAGGYFQGMISIGNIVLANSGNNDGIVIKYNSEGKVEWAKNVGGSGYDYIQSVSATSDGGCIAGGYFASSTIKVDELELTNNSTVSINPYDGLLIKYTSEGKVEWARNIGGNDYDYIQSVFVTNDGGIIVGGYFASSTLQIDNELLSNKGETDGLVIKYDNTGEVEWAKSIGGTRDDYINSVIETSDGGVLIGGYFKSNTVQIDNKTLSNSSISGSYDGLIVKYNNAGEVEWTNNIGGSDNDEIRSVAESVDGGYIVGGYYASSTIQLGSEILTNNGSLGNDGLLIKYTNNGIIEWVKNIGGSSNDYVETVIETYDGRDIAGGYFSSSTIQIDNHTLENNGDSDGMILDIINQVGVPETQELVVENEIKDLKITTATRTMDDKKGGSISGEGMNTYETIRYGENSTKPIIITPEEGYEIINITVNGEELPFTANEDGTYTMPQFTNVTEDKFIVVTFALKTNKLIINKIDSKTGAKLPGASFIIKEIDSNYYAKATTNSSGQAIAQVHYGNYEIIETKAPEGYEPNTTPLEISFTEDGSHEFTIENTHKSQVLVHHYLKTEDGQYSTTKVAEDELLEGKNGEKYTTSPKLDLNEYELEKDEDGEYVIPANATGTFEPGITEVTYYYQEKKIPLTVHHYIDGTTTPVPLKNGDTAKDETYSGKKDEEYSTSAIENNKLSDDYELVDTPSNATGVYSGNGVVVTYYYKKVSRQVLINKYDEETNSSIEGAKFTIASKDAPQTIIGEYITDSNGQAKFNLEAGDYIATEIEVPEGYKLPENNVSEFSVSRENDIVTLNISNARLKGTVITHYYIEDTNTNVPNNSNGVVEDVVQTGNVGEIYATKEADNVSENYELVSTEGETSGIIQKDTIEVTYYYRLKSASVLVHHYIDGTDINVPSKNGGVVEDELINGRVTDTYNTSESENVANNYEVVEENLPKNSNGTMTLEQIVVTYYYKLKEPTIEQSKIDKTSTLEKVTEKDQAVPYSITYSANVDTYIGEAEVIIVDTLPYAIDKEKSNLNDGNYDENTNTITWTESITGIDTFANGEKQINVTKNISLVYQNLDVTKASVTNKVTGTLNLKTPEKTNTVENTKDIPTEFLKDVKVTKVWNDNGNSAGKRPNSVTLVLTGNGQTYKQPISSINAVAENENNWEYTFIDLPEYDESGKEIDYQVSEERSLEDNNKFYVESYDQTSKTITNTFSVPDEKITVTAKKYWDDNGNSAGKRPETAILTLTGKGKGVDISKEQEITSSNRVSGDDNTWEYTFTELPKYDNNGDEVVYTINEKNIESIFYIKSDVNQETRTITNTFHVPGDKVDVVVTKVWDDNNNFAEKRPASATLQVKNGNQVVASEAVTIDDAVNGDQNKWSHTFNVPKYDENGDVITYTADEENLKNKFYTRENTVIDGNMESGYTITNKFVVPDERISIPVTKIWDDNNNFAGKRPSSVTMKLKGIGEGVDSSYEEELTTENVDSSNENIWRFTFTDLPNLDEKGNEINYVLSEKLDNIYYKPENSKVEQDTKTITNTFKVPTDKITIPVVKIWDDNNNIANKRPDDVVLVLTGNDGSNPHKATLSGHNADLNDGNKWLYTFTDLPKYNSVNGDEIIYTLSEEDLGNKFYTRANTVINQEEKTVTNKFEVPDERTQVTVNKVWNDNNNRAGKRLNSVTISISGNGKTEEVVLNSGYAVENQNIWEYTFTNLQKLDSMGDEIEYTIAEEESQEENSKFYTSSVSQLTKTVTNTFQVPDERISVPVTKVWDDNGNSAGKRPSSLTMVLRGTGEGVNTSYEQELTSQNADPSNNNHWTYTFSDLPKYDANGDEIEYLLSEKLENIYYTNFNSDIDQDTKTITNKFKVPNDKISIPVTIDWNDNGNIANKRPSSIDIVVTASDGSGPYRNSLTKDNVDDTDSNKWTYTFMELPKYNSVNGDEITYSVNEENVNSKFYITSVDQQTRTITNTFSVPDETVSVTAKKVWDDNGNFAEKRPDSAILTVIGIGEGVNISKEEKVTEDDAINEDKNTWEYTFTNLPKYDDYGDEISYTINEKDIESIFYIKSNLNQETRTVTNKFQVPGDKANIVVTKVWDDNGDIAGKRPASVTLQVKNESGIVASEVVTEKNAVNGDKNRWQYTFSVPKYDEKGNIINYTADEENLNDKFYTAENKIISGDMNSGYTITNKFVVPDERISVPVAKVWDDNGNSKGKRSSSVIMVLRGTGEGVNTSYKQELTSQNADPSNNNSWTYTFNNLPRLDNYGNDIIYTVDEEDLGNKFYKKGSIDQISKTVTNISVYGRVIVHHYIMDDNGITTTTKVPSIDGGEVQDDIIEGAQGEEYTTNPAGNIMQNYELVQERIPNNKTGEITKEDTEVIYYYRLKNPSGTNTIEKSGTDKITSANQEMNYTITYNANINDYIGNAEVTIIDTLPYALDTSKSNDLDGGTYNETDRTITWTENVSNLNSYNGKGTVNITKNIKVFYVGLDMNQEKITNNVKGHIKLLTPERISKEASNNFESTIYKPIISAEKYVDKTETSEKDKVTYTVRIKNTGNLGKTVTLADSLPEGMSFDSSTQIKVGNIGTSYTEENLKSGIQVDVPEFTTVDVVFAGIVDDLAEGEYSKALKNVASVDNKQTNEVITNVTKANISAKQESDPANGSKVRESDTITYRIKLKNDGTRDGTALVKDVIPTGTTFVDGSIKVGDIADSSKTALDLQNGINVAVGINFEVIVEFKVIVNTLVDGTILKNIVYINTNGQDEKIPEELQHTYVEPKDNPEISMTGTSAIENLDQEITYNISYLTQISDYEGKAKVVLVDKLPYALDETKSELDGGTYDALNKTITWEQEVQGMQLTETKEVSINKQIKVVYQGITQNTVSIENIVNAHIEYETPERIGDEVTAKCTTTTGFIVNIPVSKVWEDEDNKLGQRPTKVVFKLKGSDGSERTMELAKPGTKGTTTTQDSTNPNKWNDIFTNLPKYDVNNQEIKYTVTEINGDLSYYSATVDNTGRVVTNTNKYGKVTVHHYIMNLDGTKTTNKVIGTDGQEIQDEVIEGKEGEPYKAKPAENINEKYELVQDATVGNSEGILEKYNEEKPQEVTYYYRLKPAKVIIHYIEKDLDDNDGNNQVLANNEQIDGHVDDKYNTDTEHKKDKIEKDGKTYTLVSKSGNVQGNMTVADTNVTYYYLQNTRATVRYVERDSETHQIIKDLETPYTKEGLVGDEFVTNSKNFQGYKLVESPEKTKIKMTKEEQTLIYYYEKIKTKLLENHIDDITGKILYTEEHNVPVGDNYNISSKNFEGYDLVENKLPENNKGTIGEEAVTVNYYYIKKAVLEVNYIDRETGEPLAEQIVDDTKHEGDSYTTEQRSIEDYDLVDVSSNANGILAVETDEQGNITNNRTVVTYYYAKKSTGVEVHHIDILSGEELEPLTLQEGHIGDLYDIKPKEFLSYAVAETDKNGNNILPANAKGKMTKDKIVVNYYYYQPAKVIVHFVDKTTGKEIEETNSKTGELQNSQVILEGQKDDEYTTNPKEFEYYSLVESPKDSSGKMKVEITKDKDDKDIVNNTIELYYYYEPKPFNLGVEKEITGIIINGNRRSATNGKLERVEIYRKSTENTSVQIEYKIKVINTSKVEGRAIIEDKLPEGMSLAHNDGTWEENNGTLRKVIPEIKGGETKEYTVLLNWKGSGENMGNKVNEVSLIQTDNVPGFKDENDKDNTDEATAIISVETGEFPTGLLFVLAILVVLESVTLRYAVVLTKRHKDKK